MEITRKIGEKPFEIGNVYIYERRAGSYSKYNKISEILNIINETLNHTGIYFFNTEGVSLNDLIFDNTPDDILSEIVSITPSSNIELNSRVLKTIELSECKLDNEVTDTGNIIIIPNINDISESNIKYLIKLCERRQAIVITFRQLAAQ